MAPAKSGAFLYPSMENCGPPPWKTPHGKSGDENSPVRNKAMKMP